MKPEENKKDIKSIEIIFSKDRELMKYKNEIYEIKKWEEKIKREDLKNKTKNYTDDYRQYETKRYFGESIYTRKANIVETEEDQSNLLKTRVKFNNKSRPRTIEGKYKKRDIHESAYALCEGRKLLNAFKAGKFPIKEIQGKELKISTPKQMLQRLQIALAQGKAGNTYENVLNELKQIIYSLY